MNFREVLSGVLQRVSPSNFVHLSMSWLAAWRSEEPPPMPGALLGEPGPLTRPSIDCFNMLLGARLGCIAYSPLAPAAEDC